jgi:two-component system OmpR family response regulator
MGARILVVEDDPGVAGGLVRRLRQAGYEVELATDGPTGLRLALESAPDLIVLDLMLPGLGGEEILTQLTGRRAMPIIALTAKAELADRLRVFGLGAADYVPKPFFPEELLARIATRIGRPDPQAPNRVVRWAGAEADLDARTLAVDGTSVELTPHEFDVLRFLLERPGKAVTRQTLADAALSPLSTRSGRTVDSHVARLRRKLGAEAADAITTVWGIGYRFVPEPEAP